MNRLIHVGLGLLAMIALCAIMAPWLAPYDPTAQDIANRFAPVSSTHWLGTDSFGRDILSRLLWGARISLLVGLLSVAFGMSIGSAIGMYAGYRGGWIDQVVLRIVDVLLAFPSLITGMLVVAVLGATLPNLVIAIGLTLVPKFARIARAPTLTLKRREFIDACRVLGFYDARILLVHILPNAGGQIVALGALWAAATIRIESSLAFIGLGVEQPTPTWGSMIREGFDNLLDAPGLAVYPGLAILVLVIALNLVGDGMRDAVDPKLREE